MADKRVIDPIGCFVAGTLVHTKEGLKPIEQIKVGDWVLSKPESGEGEQAYTRVVKTFRLEEKEVVLLTYYLKEALDSAIAKNDAIPTSCLHRLVVTGNHPFWIKGLGWVRADHLECDNEFDLFDGQEVICHGVDVVYRTAMQEIGWFQGIPEDDEGYHLDLRRKEAKIGDDLVHNKEVDWWDPDQDTHYRTTVYNLEVEDYHTYYVGEQGVWVHNTDCGGDVGRAQEGARDN